MEGALPSVLTRADAAMDAALRRRILGRYGAGVGLWLIGWQAGLQEIAQMAESNGHLSAAHAEGQVCEAWCGGQGLVLDDIY